MIWDTSYKPKDGHAFLSPSKPHWVNYTPERLAETYANHKRAADGTKIHSLAEQCIRLKVRLPNNTVSLNAFVNDALGYKMKPEMMLYYSENAFGTADAISFTDDVLRIHDLKTGVSPGNKNQLEVYAALFCLQYRKNPNKIKIHLQIYQSDEITMWEPLPEDILRIMGVIKTHDKYIKELKGMYD